jgi:SAM-dependent methyltransferase
MSESETIPFWGPEQLELFHLMAQAIDPEGRIPAAMQAAAPIEGRSLLDVGAGVGDRTIVYARLAEKVYALEPDPKALPILRGRIRSSGVSNVTVLTAGAEAIPLEENSVHVAYATWAYFFGPGSEPGLAEVERVVQPGGDIVVVQNYGHDELARLWTPDEARCEEWPPWFAEHGFGCNIVDTVWRFQSPEEAVAVLGFLWGEGTQTHVQESGRVEFGYKVAVYHRRVPEPGP